ncbi:MAG: hypothetical protein HYY29_05020, partial [Chloroflexi bacterium]|nr:hypothetical protein [Chloroflexota bacterium]
MKNHRFDLGSFVLALVLAGVLVLGISRPAGSAPEIGPPVSQVDRLADHNGEGEQEAPPKQVVMTSGGILRGNIGSVAHPAWKIADQSVTVNNSTEVKPGMDMGIPARAHVFTQPDGSMLAMTVERALKPPVAPASAPWENFSGMVTSVGSGGRWIIGGHMVMVNRNSQVKPGATLGNRVRVTFTAFGNGPLTALAIEPDMDGAREIEASFSGVAAAIPEGVFRWGTWTVEGQNFIADRVTEIQPGLEAGDNIRVTFIPLSDGIRAATRIERELEFSSELVAFQSLIMNSATPGATTSGPVTGAAPGSGTVPGGDSVAPGGSNSTGTGGSGGGSVNS